MNENTWRQDNDRLLLPHQQALINRFFAETKIRGYVVRWDVGLGKSFTIASLVKRLLAAQPTARILILSWGRMLQFQMQEVLARIGVNAEVIDRFRYREMQGTSFNETPWREGGVFILGVDFAKRDDITLSLCSVPWTLLIVDEAHQIRGQREDTVQKIIAASPELRLLLYTLPGLGGLPTFELKPWTETVLHQKDVVDAQGQSIFTSFPTEMRLVEFQLNSAEQRLRNLVSEVVELLPSTNQASKLLGSILESSMQSSLSTLEEVIRRFRNRLIHKDYEAFQLGDEQYSETDSNKLPLLDSETVSKLLVELTNCLIELDTLATDSKLEALTSMLTNAKATATMSRSMCILTEYRSTLFYLQTALEELGFAPYILHGTLSIDERLYSLQQFTEHGGILLATTAILKGISLSEVDSLVMYDLPRSSLALQVLFAHFQGFGRKVPLTLNVLLEHNDDSSKKRIILSQLQSLLTDNPSVIDSPLTNPKI
jgi:hypothetical protein